MIQFNLLPDVKIEYIKAQRMRQVVLSVSVLVTVVSLLIAGLSFGANILQKKHLKDLTADINSNTAKLKGKPQIDKILTVQNQLQSLTTLHDGKPAASRLFDYLNQVTPAKISLTSYAADFAQHTVTVVGTSDSLSTVNKYVDTLKFTDYTSNTVTTKTRAFTNVVLASFGLASDAKGSSTSTFTVTYSYDQNIFDIKQTVKLAVPSIITTRSEVDKPSDLFTDAPASSTTPPATTGNGGKK